MGLHHPHVHPSSPQRRLSCRHLSVNNLFSTLPSSWGDMASLERLYAPLPASNFCPHGHSVAVALRDREEPYNCCDRNPRDSMLVQQQHWGFYCNNADSCAILSVAHISAAELMSTCSFTICQYIGVGKAAVPAQRAGSCHGFVEQLVPGNVNVVFSGCCRELYQNMFYGPIPAAWGRMGKLQVL
jgi:hypothetical protein